MDPALLCEAQLGEDETDSEIVLAESEESEEQESLQNNKRPHPSNGEKSTPTKKMRESFSSRNVKNSPHSPSPTSQKQATSANHKINMAQKAQMQRQRLGTPPGSNARVSAPARMRPGSQLATKAARKSFSSQSTPSRPAQSVTWKYRSLQENAYTADVKKSELLKDYEQDKCECKPHVAKVGCGMDGCKIVGCRNDGKVGECKPPDENVGCTVKGCNIAGCRMDGKGPYSGKGGCRSGCHNRAIYVECDKDLCSNGEHCGNRDIQRMQYAPGLERFMTKNKGWGVRARQSVAKGTFILEYTGEIVSQKEFEKRMLSGYIGDEHHYCLALDSKHMIDAHRAGSECRFVNHSCDPNCEMAKWSVKGLYRMALFAKKDILANTEICYDYNFSLFDSDKGQTCNCGAAECRGVIGGKNKDFAIKIQGTVEGQSTTLSIATDPLKMLKEDEKWFNQNVDKEELAWFQKNAAKPNQVGSKQVKCTVCNDQLNHTHLGSIQRHPALGVVMCNDCRKKYDSWDKSDKSEDGNDDSCRWCTEGGNIFLCDYCPNAFCQKCIKWNLGRKLVKEINDAEKWKCLLCDPSPLKEHRSMYWAVHQYHKMKQSAKNKNTTPVKTTPIKHAKKVLKPEPQFKAVQVVRSPLVPNGQTPSRGVVKPPMNAARGSPSGPRFGSGNAMPRMKNNSGFRPANSTVVNHRPMNNGRFMMGNGSRESPTPNHWLDKMMKEVEDASNQTMELMNNLRHDWTKGSRGEDEETKITKQVRQVLQINKKNIDDLDKKIINDYRMNREEADLRDIEPEKIDKLKFNESIKREKEIFSKSSLEVENDNIDGVVCTPDMPVFPECSDGEDEADNVESEQEVVTLDDSDCSDNDSDIESAHSDESGINGSGTEESESEGEIKMTKAENEDMDESSAELSEVDSARSDSNGHTATKSKSEESKKKVNGVAKESDNEDTVTGEDPGSNEGVKTEAKSDNDSELETEAKTDIDKVTSEVQSDKEEKVNTEKESDNENVQTGEKQVQSSDGEKNIKTEAQSDGEEKVKTEAKSDGEEKVKTEAKSDGEEKVIPEAKSDGENVEPEEHSDTEEKVKPDSKSYDEKMKKTEVESDSDDKVMETESVDKMKVKSLDMKVNLEIEEANDEREQLSTNNDEKLHSLSNNGDDSKLDSSDRNLDTECQDSKSKLDDTKGEVDTKHKDTEKETTDMDES